MSSFFFRWFKGLRAGSAPPVPAPEPGPDKPTVMEPGVPAAIAALGPAGRRRPLISGRGALVGFEFRLPAELLSRSRRSADPAGAAAHVAGILASALRVAQSGRLGLARLPADWVLHAPAPQGHPNLLIGLEDLASDPLAAPAPEPWLAALRAQKVRIGWPPAPEGSAAGDFVLQAQRDRSMTEVLQQRACWPVPLRARPWVLTDLADVEDLEAALASGASLVCGALASKPGQAAAADALAPVPPEVRRIGQLLHQLANGADTAPIADAIKGDVGLSLRLLKRLSAASLAQARASASIDQAVLMLGRNELYRWLSVLMLQYAGTRRTASALQDVALWRARLMELLALGSGHEAPGELFSLGLASMLGLLLKLGPSEVADTLNLSPPGRQALVEQAGPWRVFLRIPEWLEQQTLDTVEEDLSVFGGAAQVQALSDEAWAWVATHSESPAAEPWPKAA